MGNVVVVGVAPEDVISEVTVVPSCVVIISVVGADMVEVFAAVT